MYRRAPESDATVMMAVIFATILVALLAMWLRFRRLATGAVLASLALAIHLFLWEIWRPETDLGMPWIRTDAGDALRVG